MKRVLAALLFAALALGALGAHASTRYYSQPELDSLLAPIALYPDTLLADILVASTYPDDVHQAAAWLRDNPQLQGAEAVRPAAPIQWHPSLKALLAFPDVVQYMDANGEWMENLGAAYIGQQAQVMQTVQALRLQAQAPAYAPAPSYAPSYAEVPSVPYVVESPSMVFFPAPIIVVRQHHFHRPPRRVITITRDVRPVVPVHPNARPVVSPGVLARPIVRPLGAPKLGYVPERRSDRFDRNTAINGFKPH